MKSGWDQIITQSILRLTPSTAGLLLAIMIALVGWTYQNGENAWVFNYKGTVSDICAFLVPFALVCSIGSLVHLTKVKEPSWHVAVFVVLPTVFLLMGAFGQAFAYILYKSVPVPRYAYPWVGPSMGLTLMYVLIESHQIWHHLAERVGAPNLITGPSPSGGQSAPDVLANI
jgi:hypothetical protein